MYRRHRTLMSQHSQTIPAKIKGDLCISFSSVLGAVKQKTKERTVLRNKSKDIIDGTKWNYWLCPNTHACGLWKLSRFLLALEMSGNY